MTERFLQYIWQFQYFNKKELVTTHGEPVDIVDRGTYNSNQGPDFLNARIRIGLNIWVGSVELHLRTSGWRRHSHDNDVNYGNVILHVVFADDEPEIGSRMPLLVLQDRIPKTVLSQYERWMQNDEFIPCGRMISAPDEAVWVCWKERLLVERLLRRWSGIAMMLKRNKGHWEETMWWLLARNFGISINADAFQEVAMSVPYGVVVKTGSSLLHLEALLFGQAGLLDGVETNAQDDYYRGLKETYAFLSKKYQLMPVPVRMMFLRMRPACFPTVRMAQLAILMHRRPNLFAVLLQEPCHSKMMDLLPIPAGTYWNTHFLFGETSACYPKKPGKDMISSLLVNTMIPLLFAYGEYHGYERYRSRALEWIRQVDPEKNSFTRKFMRYGVVNANAADSQSLLELKARYCDQRRCLDCAVGNAILRRKIPGFMPAFSS